MAANETSHLARLRILRESPTHNEGGRSHAPLESENEQFIDVDVGLHPYEDRDAFYLNNNQAQGYVGDLSYLPEPKDSWSHQTGMTPKAASLPSSSGHPTAYAEKVGRSTHDHGYTAGGQTQTSYGEDFMDDTGLMTGQRNSSMLIQSETPVEPNFTDTHGLYQPLPVSNNIPSNHTISKPRFTSSNQLFSTKVNNSHDSSPEWAYWWICRCTPLPLSPPAAPADLALSLLENLADLAVEPAPWNSSDEDWRKRHFGKAEFITNIPISEATRECMLVILQRYLRIAVEVHDLDLESLTTRRDDDQHDNVGTDYLRLPSTQALHNFMELFLRRFEPYYPLLPGRSLDPNKLVKNSKSKALMLLLLSMLACGSMIDPAPNARQFSTVISEICRLSIMNISFKDPSAAATPIFLHCALLSTIKGAFSGVKLHMSILKHTGILKDTNGGDVSNSDVEKDPESAWKCWIEKETASRLAYSWALVDHEVSLFYDLSPLLSISELKCRLPVTEKLWLASNSEEWLQGLMHGPSPTGDCSNNPDRLLRRMSLFGIFEMLLNGRLDEATHVLEPFDLRLLLSPLHVLITDLRQLLDCLPERGSGSIQLHSVMLRFQEIQQLMQRWLRTFRRVTNHGVRSHAMAETSMILYHVTYLNLLTSFKKIEIFARADPSECASTTDSTVTNIRDCSPDEALLHCCQILSLMQEMKDELRPVWSAAAIYRATLILWTISLANLQGSRLWVMKKFESRCTSLQELWETWNTKDTSLHRNLQYDDETPYYVCKDGNRVSLDDPAAILQLGLDTLSNGCLTSAFTEGVRSDARAYVMQ
ncbi:hypothetical protein FOXYS1_10611 [Fusarium oxysporum]|uniref:Xylanolytic transcriptional activator regulatory domain-containing protein n=1 Tax=Fusarium oxysporum TaxID=5507 RepID=A0A8H5A4M0_FUSOX|nr:hypothetical protein FOXYS1_10611 [Fusarium oxysporum]